MPDEDPDQDEISAPSPEDPEMIEEAAEEAMKSLPVQVVSDIAEVNATLAEYVENIEVQTFESPALQIAQSQPVSDPNEDVAQSDPQSEKLLKELNAKFDALLKANAANQPSLIASVAKWLAIGGITAASGGTALVFELIARFAHKQTGAGVPVLSDAEKAQFQAAVQGWALVSDTQYWTSVYAFAQASNANCADLIYFMQYTKTIFPLAAPYIWPQLSDETNLANQLFTTAQQAASPPLSVVAQLEPGIQDSQGTPLPRSMAASVAILALTQLAALPPSDTVH